MSMASAAGPWALRAAATLCLADRIAGGICDVATLARATSTDPDALGRLLRFLACRGIFEEIAPDVFTANAAARMLCDSHPSGLRAWLDLSGAGGRMDSAWPRLLESIQTGRPAYAAAWGSCFWDDLAADASLKKSFDALMSSGVRRAARDVAGWQRWRQVRRVIDVGGGDASLLLEILKTHPDLTGSVLDLPDTSAAAMNSIAASGLTERCSFIAGNFFEEIAGGADIYVLANVLHDWSDADAGRILRRCATAAGATGSLLIVEPVRGLTNDRAATEDDLRFLLVFGGRARSLAQFAALAAGSGLRLVSAASTPSGVGLVECAALDPTTPRDV